jgi:hypothetical protein
MFFVCYHLLLAFHLLPVKHCIGHWALQSLANAICFYIPTSFGSAHLARVSFTNNYMKKGRWTQVKHKIFMQKWEKYDNNSMQIAKVLSTRTPAHIKSMLNVFSNKIGTQILLQLNDIESLSLPIGKHKSWSKMLLNNKNIDNISHRRTKPKC